MFSSSTRSLTTRSFVKSWKLLPMIALVLAVSMAGCARTSDLMDESFLQIDSVRKEFEKKEMIHEDDKTVKFYIKLDGDDKRYWNYCPEEYYLTVDPQRKPETILHHRCNQKVMLITNWNCLQHSHSGTNTSVYVCHDQVSYRKIKLRKKYMYQKVYTGCYCSAKTIKES